ncbi:hypothetical protein BDZ88DRAFT_418443 [Geranomyces variabilis]|nr:hypothetical protein BDZ88DRAFT_418443 [Geranomyces variabilis]
MFLYYSCSSLCTLSSSLLLPSLLSLSLSLSLSRSVSVAPLSVSLCFSPCPFLLLLEAHVGIPDLSHYFFWPVLMQTPSCCNSGSKTWLLTSRSCVVAGECADDYGWHRTPLMRQGEKA